MASEKQKLLKTIGMASSMGLSVAIAIMIGVFIGRQLDAWFETKFFFFIFLFIGIAAGFRNIFVIAGREMKDDDRNNEPPAAP